MAVLALAIAQGIRLHLHLLGRGFQSHMYLRLLVASSEVLNLRGEVFVEKGAYEGIQELKILMDFDMAALIALIFEKVVASI